MAWWHYSRSTPKKVKGGIKAQSRGGKFGKSWWAQRWNQTLEEYNMGARLGRGRSYARSGQVESIKITKGKVTAVVHGSSTYKVAIDVDVFKPEMWSRIARDMFARPSMSAHLLAGRMPEDIEDVFVDAGTDLFPRHAEIETDCTCPDWSNPCKHIAAVYLLLAEEFDRDPFLIFQLRGTAKKDLLKLAGMGKKKKVDIALKKDPASSAGAAATTATSSLAKMVRRPRRLSADPKKFWGAGGAPQARKGADDTDANKTQGDEPDTVRVTLDSAGAAMPAIPAALVKQVGVFPFWRGGENFIDAMDAIYQNASGMGARIFMGEA